MKKRIFLLLTVLVLCLSGSALGAAKKPPVYWQGQPVNIKTLGSYQTDLRLSGDIVTVPSSELSWESSVEPRFGYIYAPKLGAVNMRLGPRSKASVVTKAYTGRIVRIFDQQGDYTGVIYNGKAGYVMNASVRIVEHPESPVATATLSYKGRTRGTTKITMRIAGNQGSRPVTGLRPRMAVTVYHLGESWSEVEVNGWHGWVLTEHLVDVQRLSPPETEAPAENPPEEEWEDDLIVEEEEEFPDESVG